MINNVAFAERLRKIMDYYQISASVFADRIQVPRSSISHLLSGRNKPSLDFVLKVVKEYDEVELYWLLNGKGEFPNTGDFSPTIDPIKTQSNPLAKPDPAPRKQSAMTEDNVKNIERIVIFYEDGSFKAYKP